MTWLLRLYPRAWRERYGSEMEEIVAAQPPSLQLAVDLLGGAIDAHLNRQAFATRFEATGEREGGGDMVRRLKCGDPAANMTPREGAVSAAICIVVGLAFAAFLMTDPPRTVEIVALTMLPAVLAAPMQWVYLRGHSLMAKSLLWLAPFAVCFLIGLAAAIAVGD